MMDERVLKDSLIEVNTLLADSYDNGFRDFSYKTTRKIKQLIFREKHPISYVMKNVAAVIIAFLIGGTIFLGTSKTTRATVLSWFSEVFEGTIFYRGQYESKADITIYSISDVVFKGYTFSENDSYREENEICEAYTDTEGYYLYLIVMQDSDGKIAQLIPDNEDEVSHEKIGDFMVDHYYDIERASNAYIWYDDNGTLFYIGGRIVEAELRELTVGFMEKYK